jgi:hypothetical protein
MPRVENIGGRSELREPELEHKLRYYARTIVNGTGHLESVLMAECQTPECGRKIRLENGHDSADFLRLDLNHSGVP